MTEQIVIGIVSVIVLGISAQWIAWRFRMPSILLLLIFGFLAGPVLGLLPPSSLKGDWLFAFVSLSIGIILFEGGLSLRLPELREVGKVVLNLITVGVLVTWTLAGLAAHYVAGFSVSMSILLGAILTVTGPTVVIPLLRHVRPSGRVGAVAKWEGITIDPVGAILAVLVLETVLVVHETAAEAVAGGTIGPAMMHAVQGLLLTIAISVGISVIGAGLLILLLHRRLVPDYLQSPIALMVVVGTFALSNVLQEESGLMEVTLLGIMMANQKYVPVRRITEFKEDLQVLLIACLFIVLSARLELSALAYIDRNALIFLAILILFVRPVAVFVSSFRTNLNWRERTFLSWMAPRGIVAAAVASLFALRLEDVFPGEAEALVPIVFLVIVGTVTIYGLTVTPLARWLGLAEPNPQGVLILGAHLWAQKMAALLQEHGFKVLLIDANTKNIERARRSHLRAEVANALSETIFDELDLGGIGRFLAMTPNDEVNALAALHFGEIFDSTSVYQLSGVAEERKDSSGLPSHLRGRPLFGEKTTFALLNERFQEGGEIQAFELTEELTYDTLKARYDGDVILLFVIRGTELMINAEDGQLTPEPGDTVIVFLPPHVREQAEAEEASFEQLVARAPVIDLKEPAPVDELVRLAATQLAQRLPATADRLARGMRETLRFGGILIAPGVALPHLRLPMLEEPELLLVRCRGGMHIAAGEMDEAGGTVHAILFLVSPEEDPGKHLRTLAILAGRIDHRDFLQRWLEAEDELSLKETLLREDRHFVTTVYGDGPAATFIGAKVEDLELPPGCSVALVLRRGKVFQPDPAERLREGDRVLIVGEPSEIRQFRAWLDAR
ncbi:cation:proton antiporter domain-containing protein [Rhodocaloribacter sp.]